MARLWRVVLALLALVGGLAIGGAIVFAVGGVSARPDPPSFEERIARTVRHWLIPRSARARVNPVPADDAALESGLRHWADHCAQCHGNDGRGDTALGRGLYPRSPDMTMPASQNLSDGELFWIIENGIKLTGMPAWGRESPSEEEEEESWALVHFVRRLPELTREELREMERLNPVSRAELERQLEIERFLAGETTGSPKSRTDGHEH